MNTIDYTTIDLSKEAPAREPERQYYFIAKAKEYLKKQSQEAGRPLTFCVTTFGCQMNARDSEKLSGILEQIGYVEEPDEEKRGSGGTADSPAHWRRLPQHQFFSSWF